MGRHCFAWYSRDAREDPGIAREHERVCRRKTGQCPTTGHRLVDAVTGDQITDSHLDTDIDVRVTSQSCCPGRGGWCNCKPSTGNFTQTWPKANAECQEDALLNVMYSAIALLICVGNAGRIPNQKESQNYCRMGRTIELADFISRTSRLEDNECLASKTALSSRPTSTWPRVVHPVPRHPEHFGEVNFNLSVLARPLGTRSSHHSQSGLATANQAPTLTHGKCFNQEPVGLATEPHFSPPCPHSSLSIVQRALPQRQPTLGKEPRQTWGRTHTPATLTQTACK